MADEPKRRGRPPLDGQAASIYVGVSLPPKQFDALCTQAQRRDLSLPEVIRRLLAEIDREFPSKK